MLKRTFVSRDTDLWKKLYTSVIRPYREYAVQVWNPRLFGDTERFEKIHRRATEITSKLNKISYDLRIAELGLTSLKYRRVRGDLIQMFQGAC